jgi:hypothetical protein
MKNLTGKSKTDETDVDGSHAAILRAFGYLETPFLPGNAI